MQRPLMDVKVSSRGQLSLPAVLRQRWGIVEGGTVGFIDLGDSAIVVPGGVGQVVAEVRRTLLREGAYEAGLATLDDPDLADQ